MRREETGREVLVGWFEGGDLGLEALTVVVAEDLALLADAGAWFGHDF